MLRYAWTWADDEPEFRNGLRVANVPSSQIWLRDRREGTTIAVCRSVDVAERIIDALNRMETT